MLFRRKIDLYEGSSGIPNMLLKHETLSQNALASELVEHAKARADQLMSEAMRQRDTLTEQAHLAFWQRANRLLEHWQHQRHLMCVQLERYASAIASQAFQNLLDDLPPTVRLNTLVKQLTANQLPMVQATLLCHPADRDDLQSCLAALDITIWVLRADERIRPQALVLETPEGDFHIDWPALRELLLIRETDGSKSQTSLELMAIRTPHSTHTS